VARGERPALLQQADGLRPVQQIGREHHGQPRRPEQQQRAFEEDRHPTPPAERPRRRYTTRTTPRRKVAWPGPRSTKRPTELAMENAQTYREVIERLSPRQPQGESEEAVCRGEERLGRPFPRVLRDYYRFASHQELLNQAQDRLLAPAALVRTPGAVI